MLTLQERGLGLDIQMQSSREEPWAALDGSVGGRGTSTELGQGHAAGASLVRSVGEAERRGEGSVDCCICLLGQVLSLFRVSWSLLLVSSTRMRAGVDTPLRRPAYLLESAVCPRDSLFSLHSVPTPYSLITIL